MTQTELFYTGPRAAKADPVTSHLAAQHMTTSGAADAQAQSVLGMVQTRGGMTSAELAAEIAALRERLVEADYELSGEAAHEAPGLTYRTVRVGVEWYESWRARPEVVRALEEGR